MIFRQRVAFFRVLHVWKLQISTIRTKCCVMVGWVSTTWHFSVSVLHRINHCPSGFPFCFYSEFVSRGNRCCWRGIPTGTFCLFNDTYVWIFPAFLQAPTQRTKGELVCVVKKRLIESVNKWTWVLIFTMWIVNVHSIRFRKWWYIFSFWMTLINSLFWICKTMNHKYESIKFTYQALEYRNMCSITFVIIFRLKYFNAIMFKSFSW